MNPNEVLPAALENKPANVAAEAIDMCKMQFYNPMPIVGAKLTYAYVPFQCLCCLYPPEVGLRQGTIFPELDRPYGADPVYTVDG
ncbi:MAG TPA: spore coat associated protein CotJA [Clostridia bacterium]|nr:spore coat associated protein CotJA [Clostridia bacterium]